MTQPLKLDQLQGQALLTGTVLGLLLKQQAENPGYGLAILDVRPCVDENGDYEPYIDVTLPSGTYRLGVLHHTTIHEEP